jgi:hypothetical protein
MGVSTAYDPSVRSADTSPRSACGGTPYLILSAHSVYFFACACRSA